MPVFGAFLGFLGPFTKTLNTHERPVNTGDSSCVRLGLKVFLHFPGVRVKPLCHLSTAEICRMDAPPGQADSVDSTAEEERRGGQEI